MSLLVRVDQSERLRFTQRVQECLPCGLIGGELDQRVRLASRVIEDLVGDETAAVLCGKRANLIPSLLRRTRADLNPVVGHMRIVNSRTATRKPLAAEDVCRPDADTWPAVTPVT